MIAAVSPAEQWFTLDREWTITACGERTIATVAGFVHQNLWDAYPGAEPVFRPVYERAWEQGRSAGIVHWNDTLTDLHCFKRGRELLVTFDFITLAGLRAALEQIAAAAFLEDPSPRPTTHRVWPSYLQLVAG
jgi:hypothetical protein